MNPSTGMPRVQVRSSSAHEAIRMLRERMGDEPLGLVILFCSTSYPRDELAREASRLFSGVPLIGCTSTGELGPDGHRSGTLSGVGLPLGLFVAATRKIDLSSLSAAHAHSMVTDARSELVERAPWASSFNTFAFLLVDGRSNQEERAARYLQAALGGIPLIGGSASTDATSPHAWCLDERGFHAGTAVFALVASKRSFKPFMTNHFIATAHRVVVTEANADRRIVREFDGRPAVDVYAELLGVRPDELDTGHFATAPFAVMFGGVNYIRSVKCVLPDGGLQFYCAIEKGAVLRLARDGDLLEDLKRTFFNLREELGSLDLVLGCDCVLRKTAIEQQGLTPDIESLMTGNNVSGFNSHGEQFRGIHVNQTFTGIAFGKALIDE
ncbi:MAG: FIST N-terminal domain-containing protein [Pseudomonadota bacterium]